MNLMSACRLCSIDQKPGFCLHAGLDGTCVHALFSLSIRPNEYLGTLRYDPKKAKIGRIALLPAYRRLGIGKQMMISFERQLLDGFKALADRAPLLLDSSIPTQIRLHSQLPVIGFYSKIGYQPVGPTFIEDGAPHQLMVKQLVAS
ncbi:hypothetical protein PTTG_26272 [Puccinia triticina 1-1 BBBD Race 1]|uniref:Glucosamine 6-phosphate N-acetyltransferase n=2 Tax=Puccinia triticina TaxID=208348 RepID=A0A180GVP1_PUCT1|nr:uncharacterized protein PtA15_18A102 [Puccinia triticina]OAV96865.1 hypothetical protein PTTG_26272 [Puccinia triticina 1-1 BBBD Race 1]WAQ93046.1 hypothetical protein PtA15_18A102 [Puccinia triticina]